MMPQTKQQTKCIEIKNFMGNTLTTILALP